MERELGNLVALYSGSFSTFAIFCHKFSVSVYPVTECTLLFDFSFSFSGVASLCN